MAKMKITPGPKLYETPAAGRALVGVGRRDITPPVGIYARMWGAASHDVSEGTHKPISATALAIRASKSEPPIVVVSVDLALLGDLGGGNDEKRIMAATLNELGIDRRRIIVNCTHTHGSPWTATSRSSMPGGHLLPAYLEYLGRAICEATREALAGVRPATITWATGKCSLATNRDFSDPDPKRTGKNARVVCGYNPHVKADDTVVVGRVTRDSDNAIVATVVNYACHPTTLAWLNKLISPDFIGGLRDVVESHTGGAPCLFLQGASGEMAPAHQYTGDHRVADQGGRQLGYAAMSAIESMLPPRQRLAYKGVMESGAPLAVWWPEPFEPSRVVEASGFDVPLPLKKMPTIEELQKQHDECKDRAIKERLFRKMQLVKALGGGPTLDMPAWVFRVGQSLFIAHPNEAYSCFQKDLREAFPDYTVVVMNVSGAEMGYINPPELYGENIYQVWQTPYGKDALTVLTKACIDHGRKLTKVSANGK